MTAKSRILTKCFKGAIQYTDHCTELRIKFCLFLASTRVLKFDALDCSGITVPECHVGFINEMG